VSSPTDFIVAELSARQLRIYRLLRRLVSDGAAEFFRDACGLLAEDPPRPTAVHLVAHALREVEGALRSVLEPTAKVEGHQNSINAVLQILEVDPSAPLAKMWLEFAVHKGPRNLPGWAHRSNLDGPRRPDAEFRDLVRDLEIVFYEVLERARDRYVLIHEGLDVLLRVANPANADADALKTRFRSNLVTRRYFFSRATAAWLRPLLRAGLFVTPPEPVTNDDQSWTPQPWPESDYLVRVVEQDPDGVLEAALSVPPNGNSYVAFDLVQIALALPADAAARLAPQVIAATPGPYGVLAPDRVGAFVVHLARGGHVREALDLAATLLGDVPHRRQRAASGLHGYDYSAVLRDAVPALVITAGRPALRLLCSLLDQAIAGENRSGAMSDDGAWSWRPDIAVPDEFSKDGPRSRLVDAIRAAVRQVIDTGAANIADVLQDLGGYSWTIYTRLALDLVRERSADAPAIVGRYLTDINTMADYRVQREYLALAQIACTELEESEQQQLITLIGRGPAEVAGWRQRLAADATAVAVQASAERWQRDRYAAIEAVLAPTERARYLTLVAEHGPTPDWQAAPATMVTIWGGAAPPISTEEMASMATDTLVEFLRRWQPAPTGRGEDRDSLRVALGSAIEQDATRRSVQAAVFIGLPADYIRAVVEAFWRAADSKARLDWHGLLPLCKWIDVQATSELASNASSNPREWRAGREAVLRLVIDALQGDHADADNSHDDPVWSMIASACDDPDPRASALTDDPDNAVPLDGVRPLALHAVLVHGLRARRGDSNVDLAPNLALLSKHLDVRVDASLGVRATYGSMFEFLLQLNPGWAAEHVARIFPTEPDQRRLWKAAWSGFIERRGLSDEAWSLLRPQFQRAVDGIDPEATNQWELYRTAHLGHHLVRRYWAGRLTLDEPDQLLRRFYERVPAETAAQIIESIGRSLPSDGALDPALAHRLTALWDFRVTTVDSAGADPRELGDFDRWFISGAFDDDWSLRQLLIVLKRHTAKSLDPQVLGRLAELAPANPVSCLAVLDQWLTNEPDYWALSRRSDSLREIVAVGARTDDAAAALARKIVSVLLEAHGIDLRDALRLVDPIESGQT
jgi:hypothetical protein